MTTFAAAEEDLIVEVHDRIVDLVPAIESHIRFLHRTDKEIAMSAFEDQTGRARLFEIFAGQEVDAYVYRGADTRGLKYSYDIKFWYPYTKRWDRAANSDMEKIRHDLIVNHTSVTGVQYRMLDPEQQYEFGEPEDDWRMVTISLIVYYDVAST